jgi:sugar (pentulose or hexulose) kinase
MSTHRLFGTNCYSKEIAMASKSVSFRQPLAEYERLVARATEQGKKPGELLAEIVAEWLNGAAVPVAIPVPNQPITALPSHELERLEALVCRAVWTVIVALSPTLDEQQAEKVVNHFLQPIRSDWMPN